ncbi:bifunctional riboflavin kinase/FAD synthetase [Inmirania thermothiophila]|uniref:Riboflavin biosynthesis protein n=1 Tax=Inmirania thermothiophila TaxID=1750597 RepID=A0A3N1Y8I9_9GAMM|nr:bifunctional riboflavin kinase/FAD synthetase [Inmirania thermothiophila]ROR35113.1 riboflavin kinase/FMN adenylyltransferase [Inmirania thermothiophila]
MELIRGHYSLRPRHRGCVATIGKFDGVHLGHQAVLGQVAEKAAELGLPAVVVTFEPLPEEYFAPGEAPPRLTTLREKLKALARFGVQRVLCLRFNPGLAAMEAEAFIDEVLVAGLGVRYLVVGDDFRFGRGRRGDFAMLERAGARHGFAVARMHTVQLGGRRVSSTRVREALAAGDMELVQELLGRPYRISGRVMPGDRRGRSIGFPTANVPLRRKVAPLRGVYAVEVFGLEHEPLSGVANVGSRPTVGGGAVLLEVHLFDFAGDIYRRVIHVDFLHKLREERRFASLAALKAQIAQDARQARAYLAAVRAGA